MSGSYHQNVCRKLFYPTYKDSVRAQRDHFTSNKNRIKKITCILINIIVYWFPK